jgi:hypothetical protein
MVQPGCEFSRVLSVPPYFFHIELIFNRQKKHPVGFQASQRSTQWNNALIKSSVARLPHLSARQDPSSPSPFGSACPAHTSHPTRQGRAGLEVLIQTASVSFLASLRARAAARTAHHAAIRSSACDPAPYCLRKVVVHLNSQANSSVTGAIALTSIRWLACAVACANRYMPSPSASTPSCKCRTVGLVFEMPFP